MRRAAYSNGQEDDAVAAGRVPSETRLVFPKAGVFRYHGLP